MRGIVRIQRTVRNIRRVFSPVVVILIYHKVLEAARDPFRLAVSPENFAGQLEVIRRNYTPLSLEELVEGMPRGSLPHRAVVVTFDDGYRNNCTQALPILEAHGVPATIFVTSGAIEQSKEFWWDELAEILISGAAFPERLTLAIRGAENSWPAGDLQQRTEALYAIRNQIWDRPAREREVVLAELAAQAGSPARARLEHLPMKLEELRHIAGSRWIGIGAHTRTHPVLAALDPQEQVEEIAAAKKDLETMLGKTVRTFSYPYGKPGNYSDQTVKIVREAGFAAAVTTIHGAVDPSDDPYQLRRCEVNDWGPDLFGKKLASFFSA